VADDWKCPQCGNENPAAAPTCICGNTGPKVALETPSQPRRRLPLWAAALPGLLLPLYFFVNAGLHFSNATGAITGDHPNPSKRLTCVDTYGITLNLSDQYVPEWSPGIPAANPNKSPEVSTVLTGVARNGCQENLKNVRIRFEVHDDSGKKGEGTYLIESLPIGDVKPFEHAWIGRVTSYELTAEQ
jgi:hypothetical protein